MDRYLTPVLLAMSVTIGVVGQCLLKIGMDAVGRVDKAARIFSPGFLLSAASQWQIPIAILMYAVGVVLWMTLLSRENLSYVYPFLGLTYVFVLAASHFLLGEDVTTLRLAGTLLVSLGIVLVAWK